MKYGPDIAGIAALIGDPARANILTALMGGGALTASELAMEAGVTKQTASAHLAKLLDAALIAVEKQGRHRYFRLAEPEVAQILEGLMGMAARRKRLRVRPGPKAPAMRKARVCYDHLAGDFGVRLFDGFVAQGWLADGGAGLSLTAPGRAIVTGFGIDLGAMEQRPRPLCRACLDWSGRRNHLAGAVGAALLSRFYDLAWARRIDGTRIVEFSRTGEQALGMQFRLEI